MELKSQIRLIITRHVGRGNAISAGTLSQMLFKDERLVRQTIEEIIKSGFPICSVTEHPPGYFFPANVEEAQEYTISLRKRALEIFRRRRHIIRDTARYYEEARQEALL